MSHQTRCECGHSLAAHAKGPCEGINFYTPNRINRVAGIELCRCPIAHNPHIVPARPMAGVRKRA